MPLYSSICKCVMLEYSEFAEKWKKEVVELCLHDTYVDEDKDWFALWDN